MIPSPRPHVVGRPAGSSRAGLALPLVQSLGRRRSDHRRVPPSAPSSPRFGFRRSCSSIRTGRTSSPATRPRTLRRGADPRRPSRRGSRRELRRLAATAPAIA